MLCDNADVVLDNPSATEVVSEAREEPRLNPPPPPPPVEPELGADDGFVLLGEDLGLPLGGDTPDNVRCMATFIIGPFPCLAGLPTASIRSLVLETAVVAVAVAVLMERPTVAPSPPRAPPNRPNPRFVSVPLLSDTAPFVCGALSVFISDGGGAKEYPSSASAPAVPLAEPFGVASSARVVLVSVLPKGLGGGPSPPPSRSTGWSDMIPNLELQALLWVVVVEVSGFRRPSASKRRLSRLLSPSLLCLEFF